MDRLLYWIKKFLMGHNRYCRHFCVTCEYFDICQKDGQLDDNVKC